MVGLTSDRTLLGGIPNMYVTLADAQAAAFQGASLISAVVVTGTPAATPAGLVPLSNADIETASLDQMATAVSSINNSRLFMWASPRSSWPPSSTSPPSNGPGTSPS